MPGTRTVWLPFPRLVTGTVRRCAEPERLATSDLLPVRIPDLAGNAAPLACSTSIKLGDGSVLPFHEMREFCGGLHMELDMPGARPTPEGWAEHLTRRLADFESLHPTETEQELWRLDEVWSGASRGRGVRPEADHRIAVVHDDGRAAQEALRLRAEANLVLVDGRLHHRLQPPVVAVWFQRDDRVVTAPRGGYTVEPVVRLLNDRADQRHPLPAPWHRFPLHREAEARAFLADCIGQPEAELQESYGLEHARIHDLDAYMRSEANPPPDAFARSCTAAFLDMAAPSIALHGDETVMAFLALRRALREGEADRDALLDLARTLRDAPCPTGLRLRQHVDLVREASVLVTRHERYEMDLEPDLDALAALRVA